MPDPIVPRNPADRTGSFSLLRRAVREIDARYKGLRSAVVAVFERIPYLAANEVAAGVYMLTPEQMQTVSAELQAAADRWIADGRESAPGFWWSPYVADAAQAGAAQSVANLASISEAYKASRTLQQVVYSDAYRNRVAMAQFKSYEHWTGMSAQVKTDLAQVIGRAVVDGKNPRTVVTEISERLDVSRAKAKQYAQTDITDTLRQARWAEADAAEAEFGFEIKLLWTSALLPTTRANHASRHGRLYTSEECRAFYGRDGNRYNCHCSTTETIVENGKPLLTPKLKTAMKKELADWKPAAEKK